MNILLIEDNRDLAGNLFDYFEARGHTMDLAGDGIPGLHFASTNSYDALVLDVMLPSMDGLTMCRRLRDAGKHTPILMLTARDSLEDKIAGLEAGADDYVVKPFAMREVEARLLALVRRSKLREGDNLLQVGNLSFNTDTLKIQRGQRSVMPPHCAKTAGVTDAPVSPRFVARRGGTGHLGRCSAGQRCLARAHAHPPPRGRCRQREAFAQNLARHRLPDQQ